MYKWKRSVAMVGVSLLALTSCSNPLEEGGADSEDGVTTLRVGGGFPSTHVWWTGAMSPWMDRVNELTEGQVEFETYTGGELVEEGDEAEALQNGIIDIGMLLPIYRPAEFPLGDITTLPLIDSDVHIALEAWQELFESEVELDGQTYYEREYASQDLFALPLSVTSPYLLSTTGQQFETPSDLNGTSIRTASSVAEFYSEAVGFDSVTMSGGEIYDALSRGAIDGVLVSVDSWVGFGFQDLFRYTVTGLNFGHFNSAIGMTQDTWDSLPVDVQDAMTQAHEEVYASVGQAAEDIDQQMIDENMAVGGDFEPFDELPEDVQEELIEGVEDAWLAQIDNLEERGEPGREAAILWRDAIVDAGGEVPDAITELE